MLKAGSKGPLLAMIGLVEQDLESFWPPLENKPCNITLLLVPSSTVAFL